MKIARTSIIPGLLVLLSLGCNLPLIAVTTETPNSSIPTFEPSPPPSEIPTGQPQATDIADIQPPQISPTAEFTPVPTQGEAPQASPTLGQLEQEMEAILIIEPGPGSRVTSPLRVAGEANSVFEQTLGVRLIQDDGTILAIGPVFIEAELGQRGPFSVEVPFEVSDEKQAVVQIFEASPRDGGITHLASAGLVLAGSGPEEISVNEPNAERIRIDQPEAGSTVVGGAVQVEGYALASFEQHLLVEVVDVDGNIVGSMPVTVQSEEMGIPGPFKVDVPYQVSSAGPGRIIVRDPSPAFEVDLHLRSVEVSLEP